MGVVKFEAEVTGPGTSVPTTRDRLARMIGEEGPVSASELAGVLNITATGVRRHLDAMLDDGTVEVFESRAAERRRGRPAKSYVLTDKGHASLRDNYRDLATSALDFLAASAGEDAIRRFAQQWAQDLEHRYADEVSGEEPEQRVAELAQALRRDGYAASQRSIDNGTIAAMQLCQGHCPVYQVAGKHPALCDAELEAFRRLLGLPVRRLASLARGDHVCTTHIGIASQRTPTEQRTPAAPRTDPDHSPTPQQAHRNQPHDPAWEGTAS